MASQSGMATTASPAGRLAADWYEKLLAGAAIVLMIAVTTALIRGQPYWARVDAAIWAHLLTVVVTLALTPVMLLRRRGDRIHRRLGWVWAIALFATALLSFQVRNANHGGLSWIHILSAWTMVQVPVIVWAARTHRLVQHRRSVRAMVTGAMLLAGYLTFPFNRLLGQWLFG